MMIACGGCKKDCLYSSDEYWDYLDDQSHYWEGYVDGQRAIEAEYKLVISTDTEHVCDVNITKEELEMLVQRGFTALMEDFIY